MASLVAQLVKNPAAMQETPVRFLGWEDLEKGQATHSSILGLPCGSAGEESACNAGDLCSIPGLGRSPGEGKGYPLQYSGLENSMDYIVHGVTKSRTRLSKFHTNRLFHLHIFQGTFGTWQDRRQGPLPTNAGCVLQINVITQNDLSVSRRWWSWFSCSVTSNSL